LGGDYFDEVDQLNFRSTSCGFATTSYYPIGLDPQTVTDDHFIAAFGKFQARRPLALRYHGYQFGQYNPDLGDGRGFSTVRYAARMVNFTTSAPKALAPLPILAALMAD